MPLAGSRDSVPCGVWGNAPTVPRAFNFKEAANKGAGSEASLPVTKKSSNIVQVIWEATAEGVQRAIGKPSGTMPTTSLIEKSTLAVQKRRYFSLLQRISPLRRRQGGFPVAPLTPSQRTTMFLGLYRCNFSRLRAQESAVIINRKEVILCSVILPSSSSF